MTPGEGPGLSDKSLSNRSLARMTDIRPCINSAAQANWSVVTDSTGLAEASGNELSNSSNMVAAAPLDAHVVFLTHYIPLYQVRVYQEWTRRVRHLDILLSTPIEPNREFELDWSNLNVQVQSSVMLRCRWRRRDAGFKDPLYVHFPYDTSRRLKALRPDVVVSHELGARSLAASRYALRSGAKLVLATFMSEHTEKGRGRLREVIRRKIIARADAITYNGPSCRRYLLSLGAREEQLFHWPYAADDRLFNLNQYPIDEETHSPPRHRLLCIGQLTERKGIAVLVRQLNDFVRNSGQTLEVTFVGDGPLRGELEALSNNRPSANFPQGVDSRLKIQALGNRPAHTLPALMREHGSLIAPTLADEWLLVVDEAMHVGLPVLGSIYAQAVTTLIQDQVNGWQYDPLADRSPHGSSTNLAKILRQYLDLDDVAYRNVCLAAQLTIAERTPSFSASGIIEAIRFVMPVHPASPA